LSNPIDLRSVVADKNSFAAKDEGLLVSFLGDPQRWHVTIDPHLWKRWVSGGALDQADGMLTWSYISSTRWEEGSRSEQQSLERQPKITVVNSNPKALYDREKQFKFLACLARSDAVN
jgi:hypothetical protein